MNKPMALAVLFGMAFMGAALVSAAPSPLYGGLFLILGALGGLITVECIKVLRR